MHVEKTVNAFWQRKPVYLLWSLGPRHSTAGRISIGVAVAGPHITVNTLRLEARQGVSVLGVIRYSKESFEPGPYGGQSWADFEVLRKGVEMGKGMGLDTSDQVDNWREWLSDQPADKVRALYWAGVASIDDAEFCGVHVGPMVTRRRNDVLPRL